MTPVRQRKPAKTWSLSGEVRKKPSEYEIVTTNLHYHYRRQPAPFELDPNAPINSWYLRYREGSPFRTDSWEGFRDPHQLTYQAYVQRQFEREDYLENLVDEFERRNHDASLQTDWVQELDRLYLPARFPMHALQMAALYTAQMAPSSFITNAAYFQAADELRRIQWVAYRAKSLSLDHYAELALSTYTRQRWEEDAVWQPLRETVEKMLIAYDWGEAFVALNLIVKPIFDAVFNLQLAELARSHEDALLALMLDDFALDSQRSCDWAVALVQYAVAQRPANARLLKQWVNQWKPLAYRGMEGVVELFEHAPRPLERGAISSKVRAAHDAFLARCGLNGVVGAPATIASSGEVTPMATATRKSGIDAIGDMVAWGAHFCLFYETTEDLLDGLISYCKSGLENGEYCLWVVTEPLTIQEATVALKEAVPNLDNYLADSRLEIITAGDFFLQGGSFDRKRVTEALFAKLADVSARGYTGVRLTGDTSWVTKKDWTPFCELEEGINQVIGDQRLAVLCTYSLAACDVHQILDAVRSHQFALVRREGSWDVIETAALKRAKAEIKRLNEDLEQRVVERTSELMKAEERHRLMVETASDAVVSIDETGAIQFANPATMRIFGYDPTELIGKPLTVLMPEFMRKMHEAGFRRYLTTGQRHIDWRGTEFTALRKNGKEFPVELSFGELTSDGHKVFTGFIRDIGARKQAEDRWKEAQRALQMAQAELAHVNRVVTMSELTASIAHEVNQPLAAIVASGDSCMAWLASEPPNLDKARASASRVIQAAKQASEIVQHVRAVFKKTPSGTTSVDMNELIQETISFVDHEAKRKNVSLRVDLGAGLPTIGGDRVQLQQVILNLMMNGIESMADFEREPKRILIRSALPNSGELLVSVADAGPGIDAENANRLFAPFFTTKPQGIGMGLPICRSIIEAHGGRLWAENNESGGAVFHFMLPIKTSSE